MSCTCERSLRSEEQVPCQGELSALIQRVTYEILSSVRTATHRARAISGERSTHTVQINKTSDHCAAARRAFFSPTSECDLSVALYCASAPDYTRSGS